MKSLHYRVYKYIWNLTAPEKVCPPSSKLTLKLVQLVHHIDSPITPLVMAPPTVPLLRRLGRDGPLIPAIGFGTMGMSIAYGPAAYGCPKHTPGR
jgi:hypothetical protein